VNCSDGRTLVTRKPLTASLGVGALAALVRTSGCQSHVGTAATVGNDRITTKTLDTAYAAAKRTATGQQAGAGLQAQVLTQLVEYRLLDDLAASQHVAVKQGDIDTTFAQLKAAQPATDGDQTANQQAQARALAAITALGESYAAKTHHVDAVKLIAIPVKDTPTAETVLGLLAKDPSSTAAVARKYSTQEQFATAGGDVGVQPLSGLGDAAAAVAKLKPGTADVVTFSGAIYVMRVDAQLDQSAVRTALAAAGKVTVNPRFGRWDATQTTVVAASSDIVAPDTAVPASANPLTDTQAPPASAPAEPSAPASAGPSAPAPASSAPSTTPSATPAPSASS
jgi:hypothetical protein